MENVSIVRPHRGPVPPAVIYKPEALAREKAQRKSIKGLTGEALKEALRYNARQSYYAAQRRQGKEPKTRDGGKPGVSNLPVPVKSEEGPPVRKRPGKIDALIACHRAANFAREGDIEGAELWSRFAARMLEGKE